MDIRIKTCRNLRITLLFALVLMAAVCVCASSGHAEELPVSHFDTKGLAGWEAKKFKGVTEYSLVKENGHAVVHAASHATSSGLIKKIHFSPVKYRYLRWSWKIAHTVKGGDEKTKAGDDFAARLYVVFPGRFFWQMKAISYVWANKLPRGEAVSSAYSSNVKVVAVESGDGKAGQWQAEERDVLADYRTLFGAEPPEAEAVAIMTDTDNSGGSAEAWYGEIALATEVR